MTQARRLRAPRFIKIHAAVDTLGNLLTLGVIPADAQNRDQVAQLCQDIQDVTGHGVRVAYADGSYTGPNVVQAASEPGIELQIVKIPDAVHGFILLPKRWIVERSFTGCRCATWKTRFRRLIRDYERLPETVAGLHFAVFACLMLARLVATQQSG